MDLDKNLNPDVNLNLIRHNVMVGPGLTIKHVVQHIAAT